MVVKFCSYHDLLQPYFAFEPYDSISPLHRKGLAALDWISRGHGYEITGGDVLDAHAAVMNAASQAGIATEDVNARISEMCAAPGGRFLQTILARYLSN